MSPKNKDILLCNQNDVITPTKMNNNLYNLTSSAFSICSSPQNAFYTYYIFELGSNQGLCIACSCFVPLVSFNLE